MIVEHTNVTPQSGNHAGRFSPLHLEYLGSQDGGPARYRLLEPLEYVARVNGGGLRVNVPAGFVTDFASIPRIFWNRLPHDGPWAPASVVHDYLYTTRTCSRFLADAIFRDGMAALGVSKLQRLVIFYAVRFFGWTHWRNRRSAKP